MLFNKSKFILIFAVLLVAGLAFATTRATAAVTPVLSVPDADDTTSDVEVYGIRAETVTFDLTITFQNNANSPLNTPITGFDVTDIVLIAADSDGGVVASGATASPIRPSPGGSVYATTITANDNINTVVIQVPVGAAETLGTLDEDFNRQGQEITAAAERAVIHIVRSTAPPLVLSEDRSVSGTAPFTVTLTSTQAITLTRADINVTNGFIPIGGITSDAAKKVWTVTITPGVGVTEITVEAAANGAYIFPKGTFTVDTAGPVATITGTPPIGGGPFAITIAFNESLRTGTTLLTSEITVIGGSISVPFTIPNTNSYVATLTPNSGVTAVAVQINAGAVSDVGGILNSATPSPAHTFSVAATGVHGNVQDLTGDVTISEIMFTTDGSSDEIQWIELYNSSKTEAVALDADNGWSLIIENYIDPDSQDEPISGEINFKDNGDVKTILPNQTVLIVSSAGRNSDRNHFPSNRVFDVYAEVGDEFDMGSKRDPFLNPTFGFYIELVDGKDQTADEAGNLDLISRRVSALAWGLPMGRTEDGDRTSIIRRYREYSGRSGRYTNEGEVQDGTQRESWIPAANTDFRDFSRDNSTWYGSDTDYGTPGLRAGQALPVQLSQFRPELTEVGAVVIHWMTESEVDNAGFNILRSQTKTGEFKVVNAQLIPGAGTTAERNTYTWTDTTAKPNVVYYYQIEDVSLAGERQTLATVRLRGFVSAKGKLTTQWGELKQSPD